jgi:uncharacterized protein
MKKTRLGRTGLVVTRVSFGALPIQRVPMEAAERILRKAYDAGITFYDTARAYTDSEEKIGRALGDVRGKIVIATKSSGDDRKTVLEHIDVSLRMLRTDYIDICQLHGPAIMPDPNDPESPYAGLREAQATGKVRFLGISNHRLDVARQAALSGMFDTVQFPISSISADKDLDLIRLCRERDVGMIGMKALCGGLITNIRAAFAFLWQYENLVPIWGIQRERELDQFIALAAAPPPMDDELREAVRRDRKELAGDFCRACGYCLPCPADIPIPTAARIAFLLQRSPSQKFLTENFRAEMLRIEECQDCGHCREHCPYGLDTPGLLKKMLQAYTVEYNNSVGRA